MQGASGTLRKKLYKILIQYLSYHIENHLFTALLVIQRAEKFTNLSSLQTALVSSDHKKALSLVNHDMALVPDW